MVPQYIDNILTLLAITVCADKRIFADEIDSFIESAQDLEIFSEGDENITPAKLLLWFETRRDELKARLANIAVFENWLNPILDNLLDSPHKPAILNKMIKISKSDGELHVSEKALIVLAAKRWNLKLAA